VILLEGVNDIKGSPVVTAADVIADHAHPRWPPPGCPGWRPVCGVYQPTAMSRYCGLPWEMNEDCSA
jgi:hypothetical protein